MAETEQAKTHDIFTDPAIAKTREEDPLVRFIFKYWQPILFTVLGVGLLFYMYSGYRETREKAMGNAADTFYRMRFSFSKIGDIEEKLDSVDKDSRKKLEGLLKEQKELFNRRIKALSEGKEPYRTFGELYRGLLALREGDFKEAGRVLGGSSWQSVDEVHSSKRLAAELKALVLARAFLDDPSTLAKGRAVLNSLAKGSFFVKVSAALALARVSGRGDEAKEALSLLKDLQTRSPEQSDLVVLEIKRLESLS